MYHWTDQAELSLKHHWFMSSSSQHQRNHVASLCEQHCCSLCESVIHSLVQASSHECLQSQELKKDKENS